MSKRIYIFIGVFHTLNFFMATSNTNQRSTQQSIVVVQKPKSVGLAFFLAFLFGPLGLFYATIIGGIVMLVLAVLIGFFTLGFGLPVVWLISMIWAVVAANHENKNANRQVNVVNNFQSPAGTV